MGLIEYLLIAVGVVAVIFLIVTVVRRISAYYRQQYHMSVWPGVFMLAVTTVLIVYCLYHDETINVPRVGIAGALLLATGFLDIRHAGVGMGLLALLFQVFLAAAFLAVVLGAVIYFLIQSLRRGNDFVLDAVTGTTSGFRNGVQLFFRFFVP